ncbi:MAG: hypothetical protein WCS92_02155 [Candidatus Babeliales bacterium]|jgi:hypothetical protein
MLFNKPYINKLITLIGEFINPWILNQVQDDKKHAKICLPLSSSCDITYKRVCRRYLCETTKVGPWLLFFTIATNFTPIFAEISLDDKNFVQSFINHYECNPEGRYTHEYHPYLLSHTAKSLHELAQELREKNFNIAGRIIILGYEENAVPSYYTDFTKPQIDDEMILKTKVGWSQRLHNRFGFMTAYLFKDLNKVSEKIYPGIEPVFEHVDVDTIPIFDDRAEIFQEHAFGESLDLITQAYKSIFKKYMSKNINGILKNLVTFWETIYTNAFKTGNKQVAGTQDILFSIEYVKSLINSDVPILKFFTGPDLTYPIEISCKQKKEVTLHAQKFVQKMVKKLVPINNQKTVYIFCSFVDGVGKSTMLGNIKNWMKYGEDIDSFGHVDNTSSQLAELFEFNTNVYIADLPAQISHFTYKPDGFVYTDIENELNKTQVEDLRKFIKENHKNLLEQYYILTEHVQKTIETKGFLDCELNDINKPEYWFIKNNILLKKINSNKFVPFSYQDQHFIFNSKQTYDIRLLKKLENVKSEGLKNIESEQMIFNLGVKLPLHYNIFLGDLVEKLKDKDIQNVVFVDFLSMYPRSSRENLRVNYLLQQMGLLYNDADPNYSFYKDFVSGGELLNCLLNHESSFKIYKSIQYETALRIVLYKLILQHKVDNLAGISFTDITKLLLNELENNKQLIESKFLQDLVWNKLRHEIESLEKVYGTSKSFVNIQLLSFHRLVAFFDVLQDLFTNKVRNQALNDLWQYIGKPQDANLQQDSGACNLNLPTDLNYDVKVQFMFEPECRCELSLTPFLRMLRANWYASITNLLFAKNGYDSHISLENEFLKIIPCFLTQGDNGCFYLFQRLFPSWESNINNEDLNKCKIFNLTNTQQSSKAETFVQVMERPYRIDWNAGATNIGIYQFDCNLNELKQQKYGGSTISLFVRKYQSELDNSTVMPTEVLCDRVYKNSYWKSLYSWQANDAKRNGPYDIRENSEPEQNNPNTDPKSKKIKRRYMEHGRVVKFYEGIDEQRFAARLFVRLVATLEMILKDPDSEIVVRFGNRDDFKSALKLLESITLPTYFGILFKEPLFEDYDQVEPYPSWDYWDQV